MGLLDRIRRFFSSKGGSGLDAMDTESIRSLVEDSLQETEATSGIVEQARDAHERARDLMRQGLYREALERFEEAREAWDGYARICVEQGFRNMWRGKPEQVGRELEDLRITFLDIEDPGSFRWLESRARIRRDQIARLFGLLRSSTGGVSEQEIYAAFPEHQREEVRSILFYAQRRGWIVRGGAVQQYRISLTEGAPALKPGPAAD